MDVKGPGIPVRQWKGKYKPRQSHSVIHSTPDPPSGSHPRRSVRVFLRLLTTDRFQCSKIVGGKGSYGVEIIPSVFNGFEAVETDQCGTGKHLCRETGGTRPVDKG